MKPDIIIYQVYYSYKGHVPFIESMIIANDIYDSLTIHMYHNHYISLLGNDVHHYNHIYSEKP